MARLILAAVLPVLMAAAPLRAQEDPDTLRLDTPERQAQAIVSTAPFQDPGSFAEISQRDLAQRRTSPAATTATRALGTVLAIVVLVLLVIWLVASFSGVSLGTLWRRRDRKAEAEEAAAAAAELPAKAQAPVRPPELDDSDRIAATGDAAAAIHHLLQVALETLRRRAGRPLPRHWTAREIVRRVNLNDAARAALMLLVRVTERSHFGKAPVSQQDYATCRASYLTFRGLVQQQGRS